jgi:hypothetical protein
MLSRIDNCLFGYEDGHRLLASSMRITGDSASQLTILSDLAPGARFGSSDGYWTGFPLPQLERYALMRTWPAPEMSRPGCVWTHAILFETSLFEEVDDLSQLREFARRPRRPVDLAFYAKPLDPQIVVSSLARRDAPTIPAGRAIEILDNLYGSEQGAITVEEPGDLEDEIFAIWSQQWPRLRRNFRFQTAAGDDTSIQRSPFDLRLQWRGASDSKLIPPSTIGIPTWLAASAADLTTASDHELRRFLWRYGKDVKKQRGSFKPLCEVYVSDLETDRSNADTHFMDSISSWFPASDDAFLLKQAIVDGEVLPKHQLDVFSFLLKQDKGKTFPLPSSDGIARLVNFWPEKAGEMLALAEHAISDDNELAFSVTGIVLGLIPKSSFWNVTENFPKVRRRMIQSRPDLLDADEILALDSASLLRLIELTPVNDPIGAAIVRRLLVHASHETAEKVLRHFPTVAVSELISEANTRDKRSVREWFRALADKPSLVLNPEIMARVQHTSTLYSLGDNFGWMAPEVLRAGTEPWAAGIAGAQNDLVRDDSDILGAFLIALAIQVGDHASQKLLERWFGQVHSRILDSYLPWRANTLLLPYLPDLGWRRNWDTGLRLRLIICQTYIQNRLDRTSFATLVQDRKGRELLASAAKEVDGGGPYAAAILSP